MKNNKEITIKNLLLTVLIIDALILVGSVLLAFDVIPVFLDQDKTNVYIVVGVTFFLLITLSTVFSKYKYLTDYDEFGLKKDKKIWKMAKDERDKLDLQKMAEVESIISQSTINKLTHEGVKDPEHEIESLIGLESVKERIYEIKARMEFEKKTGKKKASGETKHMIFYGNPGTGKTTVARIMTSLLYRYGYIKKNQVLEINGNILKSNNATDTETKVRMLCKKAYGGVLFIDEAYSISSNNDPMGEQAIATLIKEMEDHASEFVVILAGYTNEMKEMLDVNPGFRSRIKEYMEFADYNAEELRKIAVYMAKGKGFSIDDSYFPTFNIRMEKEMEELSWGNARTVRNVVEESIDIHAVNIIRKKLDSRYKTILTDKDIREDPVKHI